MRRNRILYFSLLLLSLFFIYFYGGRLPYIMFFIMFFLPIVSFAYVFIIYIRFKYTEDLDKRHIIKGEKVNFSFKVINEDFFLYPYINVAFCGEDTIFSKQFYSRTFSVVPFQKVSHNFELECKYRGVYDVGIKSIELEDFLGIFKLSYDCNETKQITVFPRIIHLDRFNLMTNFSSDSHSALDTRFEDHTTVSDIRKYAYGDTLKRIHWKLSAKRNELISKSFQCTSQTGATILLDLHKLDMPVDFRTIIEDKIIDSVGSVIFYCLSKWIPIDFIYYVDNLVNIQTKTPMDFDEIYRVLSKIRFFGKVGLNDVIDVSIKNSIKKTNVLIFTSSLNYELYNRIYENQLSGHQISLVYIFSDELTGVSDNVAEEILEFLPEIGVKCYKIGINDDIKHILES